ncbi:MAG: nucleotide exchange factor GrpE [Patescibacteria group bacterium]
MEEKKKHHQNIDEGNELSDNDIVFDEEKNPADAIKELRKKLKVCDSERMEYLAGWQRAKADFINQKNEFGKWKEEFISFANKNLIDELLPVVDSFNLAFGNKEAWEKVDKNWRMGVEFIYGQLESVLKKHGLSTIGAKGEKFDPVRHSAVLNVETDEKENDGVIESVLQHGFELGGKVIQPAKVTVFKSKK